MKKSLYLLLFVLAGCTSTPVQTSENTADSSKALETEKLVKSLTDTTAAKLKNTATYHTIEIKQMMFVPDTLNVHKGDTVAWINNDIVTHDITEEKNKKWTSSPLPVGKSWQMVVAKSSDYYCSIHVVMKGKIVVE